jgi:predicted metal-dependent peptidase
MTSELPPPAPDAEPENGIPRTADPAVRFQAEQALRMARAYAAEKLPWFAPALFAARLVLAENCPGLAAIDGGMRAYFNPAIVAELVRREEPRRALVELAWVWVHEISHLLRDHRDRACERNAEAFRWNVAADLEINDASWSDLEPPRGWPPLLPDAFQMPTGQLAEYYYQHLPPQWEDQVRAQERFFSDEGAGVHGHGRPWELDELADGASAVSTLEQKSLRLSVAAAMEEHKSRGDIPGGWLRWAQQSLRPQVDWRDLLRRRVRGAIVLGVGGRMDYGYQRPHRRGAAYKPLLRPSLQGDVTARVACVVDTSGSISERDLATCLAEVRGVLEAMRTPITVIPCDAVAYEPIQVFTQSDLLNLKLQGGGGTDMVAGIEAALDLKPPPDAVIVLTDGWTPYPSRRYATPVVFGILVPAGWRSHVHTPPIPPWRPEDVVIIKMS